MAATCTAGEIPRDLLDVVSATIRTVSAKARQIEITTETTLVEDLALDSLDLVRVVMLLEDRYQVEIDVDEVSRMRLVRDLAVILALQSRSAA
jgi:acyl carrier protein